MQHLRSFSDASAARAATVAGSGLVADGILQILDSQQHTGSRVVGLAGNLNLVFVAIALTAMAPCLMALGRRSDSKVARRAAGSAAAGACLLALGCMTSIINQHDLAIFPAIAGLANAAWLFGMVTMATSLWRARQVRAAVALGLPLTWIFTIPLATHGGCVVAGAYFLSVGYLLATRGAGSRTTTGLAIAEI